MSQVVLRVIGIPITVFTLVVTVHAAEPQSAASDTESNQVVEGAVQPEQEISAPVIAADPDTKPLPIKVGQTPGPVKTRDVLANPK